MLLKLWFDGTVYLGELACRLAGNYACVILVGVLESPPRPLLSDVVSITVGQLGMG